MENICNTEEATPRREVEMMRKLATPMLLLLVAVTVFGCSATAKPNIPDVQETPHVDVEPIGETTEPSLTAAFMAMVDNHSAARPQYGLAKADVVYEFICETGITRFLAAFYSRDPIRVGPIRSIRYYYLHVARAYDLPLAHVGGNMDALALREPLAIKSICDITNAGSAFLIDPTRSRPHNTYITSESLLDVAASRGYASLALPELPEGDFVATQSATKVQITYSPGYKVSWVYQPTTQHYSRLINERTHVTAEQEEIIAQNIIIIEAPVRTVEVPVDGIQSEIEVIGAGKALFLRNGKLANGTWRKSKSEAHFEYQLEDGTRFTYAPGSVWIQQVHSLARDVVYE